MFNTFLAEWLSYKDTHVKAHFEALLTKGPVTVDSLELSIARLDTRMSTLPMYGTEFQLLWSTRDWVKEVLVRWYSLEVD